MTTHDTQTESNASETSEELYDDALDTWGLQAQVDQSIEELAELIVALEGDDREAVIDNIADVQVMIDQLAVAFDEDAVSERVAEKQARLRDRIEDARAYTDGGQDVDDGGDESAMQRAIQDDGYEQEIRSLVESLLSDGEPRKVFGGLSAVFHDFWSDDFPETDVEMGCPVCGQPYVHKRDLDDPYKNSLREDYVECKQTFENTGDVGTVYVHEPKEGVDISHEKTVKHVHKDCDSSPSTLGISDRPGLREIAGKRGGGLNGPNSVGRPRACNPLRGEDDE